MRSLKETGNLRDIQVTPLRVRQDTTPSGLNLIPSTASPLADALAKVPSPYSNKIESSQPFLKKSLDKQKKSSTRLQEVGKQRVKTPSLPSSIVNLHENLDESKPEKLPNYFRKSKEEKEPHYIRNLELLNKFIGKISPQKKLLENATYMREQQAKTREMSQHSSRKTIGKKTQDVTPETTFREIRTQKSGPRTAISGTAVLKAMEERPLSYVDQLISIKR